MAEPPRAAGTVGGDVHERRFSMLLALTAGFADAFSYLTLHGLLVAHVTGNLAFMAVGIARGDPHVLLKFLALPIFIVGVGIASFLIAGREWYTDGRRADKRLAWALVLEAIFFVAAGFARHWLPASRSADDLSTFCVAILLLMAMATQNTLMRLFLPKLPSTTAMTTNVAEGMVRWTGWLTGPTRLTSAQERRDMLAGARRIGVTVTSFAVGAVAGGLAALKLGNISLGLPVCLLLYLSWLSVMRK